eukprot:snap_masked-scaffold_2-processed-gene-10.19-mRNA-1 protein AED:1.00 eAED:1.00 QI:0/0/0/0/1/1/2/0/70
MKIFSRALFATTQSFSSNNFAEINGSTVDNIRHIRLYFYRAYMRVSSSSTLRDISYSEDYLEKRQSGAQT